MEVPMKLFKKRFFNFVVSAALTFSSTLSAYSCAFSNCNGTMTVEADYLFWKIEGGSLVAGSFLDAYTTPDIQNIYGQSIAPHYNFESGGRVKIGYELPNSFWEFSASLSYIPFKASTGHYQVGPGSPEHSQLIVGNGSSFPGLSAFSTSAAPAFANLFAEWKGEFFSFDLDIAREFTFCECFHFRPHLGFRAIWLWQSYNIEGDLASILPNDVVAGAVQFSETFQGYGIESGCWVDWEIGCGWSLIGHAGGSALYSDFFVQQNINSYLAGGILSQQIYNAISQYSSIASVDYFLGIQYSNSTCGCCWDLYLGWEQHIFFDVNMISVNGGNFSGQGATLGLNMTF